MADVQQISQEQQSKKKYDKYIKEFMDYCSQKNTIRFINRLYGTDLPLDSKVVKLATESNNDGEERRSDFMIKVGTRVFHIEVESRYENSDDVEMIFRMFEYGFRNAYTNRAVDESDTLNMTFPTPLVIYLRSNDKTPSAFTVNLEIPGNKNVSFKVPVKKLADYTPETLIDGNLYALALFYPLKYEALLCKKHTSEDELKFLEEATSIIDKVIAENEAGEISTVECVLILSGFEDIFRRVINKAEILEREEVDAFMENIRTQYAFKETHLLVENEKKKGLEIAKNLLGLGLSIEQIVKATGASRDDVVAMQT
jgi:hypothetical protein